MLEKLKNDFDLLTEIATELSMQFDGIDTEHRQKKVSTYYLAKLAHSCWSLQKLLPKSDEDFLDYPSIAAICRNIIELTNLCWYYCIDDINSLESEFRFLLYDFHDSTALNSIYDNLGFELDDQLELHQEREALKILVIEHQNFKNLSTEEQKQVKKGRKSALLNHFQIAEKRNINAKQFHGLYKLLSTHTHSTATSINHVVYSQIHSSEMDKAFLGFTMHFTSSFIAEMIRSAGILWGIEFAKIESKEFIDYFANLLYIDT